MLEVKTNEWCGCVANRIGYNVVEAKKLNIVIILKPSNVEPLLLLNMNRKS